MLLISKRLNLNSVEIYKINDLIYYRIIEINKNNKFYIDIRDVINEDFVKYKDITLSKYFIRDDILYYLNRL